MKPPLLLIALLGLCAPAAQAQNFEAPVYKKDQSVDGVEGWQGQGGTFISTAESSEGAQSLRVGAESVATRPITIKEVTFVDLRLLAVFRETASPEGDIDLLGSRIAFVKQGAVGRLLVKAKDGTWTAYGREIPLAAQSTTEGWLRLTTRIDPTAKGWDLYLDGAPITANLPLAASPGLAIHGATPEVYADELTVTTSNPLFPDHDRDGLPDAEEIAAGLDPYADDRIGDIDGDGIANVDEFFRSAQDLLATATGPAAKGRILYVDNASGNDANTGRRSYALASADGPLASLKSALQAAPNDSTIIILPGRGLYDEGSANTKGKRLIIRTVAPITIQ